MYLKEASRVVVQAQAESGRGPKGNSYSTIALRDVLEQLAGRRVEKVEERIAEHERFVAAKGLAGLSEAMHAVNGQLRVFGGDPMVRITCVCTCVHRGLLPSIADAVHLDVRVLGSHAADAIELHGLRTRRQRFEILNAAGTNYSCASCRRSCSTSRRRCKA
jgi:hypothetical protein